MKLINIANADLPENELNLDLSGMCKIKEGIIKKINVKDSIGCGKDVYIYVKSSNGYFILKNQTASIGECVGGSYILQEKLPKEGQKIDMLVKYISIYEGHWYIGSEKNKKGDLIFQDTELGYKPEVCLPNSNFIEFHKEYFIIGTGIIFLTVLGIIVFKRFRKNRK